jgi:hypothetical protein
MARFAGAAGPVVERLAHASWVSVPDSVVARGAWTSLCEGYVQRIAATHQAPGAEIVDPVHGSDVARFRKLDPVTPSAPECSSSTGKIVVRV